MELEVFLNTEFIEDVMMKAHMSSVFNDIERYHDIDDIFSVINDTNNKDEKIMLLRGILATMVNRINGLDELVDSKFHFDSEVFTPGVDFQSGMIAKPLLRILTQVFIFIQNNLEDIIWYVKDIEKEDDTVRVINEIASNCNNFYKFLWTEEDDSSVDSIIEYLIIFDDIENKKKFMKNLKRIKNDLKGYIKTDGSDLSKIFDTEVRIAYVLATGSFNTAPIAGVIKKYLDKKITKKEFLEKYGKIITKETKESSTVICKIFSQVFTINDINTAYKDLNFFIGLQTILAAIIFLNIPAAYFTKI